MHGHHLTIDDREIIAQLIAAGNSQTEVANRIGCHRSTISRELNRNSVSWDWKFTLRIRIIRGSVN